MQAVVDDFLATPHISELCRDLAEISMLDASVLELLRLFARHSRGAILEVGPYLGASTVALSSGAPDRRVVTIEAGGVGSNPALPTDDILRDLRRNLERHGVSGRVTVIPKLAHRAYADVPDILGGEKLGLVFIDADGHVEFHLRHLQPLLLPECLIILDDYAYELKAERFKAFVDAAVAGGAFRAYGVFGFGTWFGQLNGQSGLDLLARPMWALPETGHCWLAMPEIAWPPDSMDGSTVSDLVLFEDGRELGSAHSQHDHIPDLGSGRFSHWYTYLYFSTSDNSDPNRNGRHYEVGRRDGDGRICDRRRISIAPAR